MPWYLAGALLGLAVPLLLLIGNKWLGISSALRHICAACIPSKLPFFSYDWRRESWNLFFVGGIFFGGWVATHLTGAGQPAAVSPQTAAELHALGIQDVTHILPADIFGNLLSPVAFVFLVIGGFLVGFGTRYAGGCTSGHTIMGLANFQLPSLYASIAFMAGGFLMTHIGLPILLRWLL